MSARLPSPRRRPSRSGSVGGVGCAVIVIAVIVAAVHGGSGGSSPSGTSLFTPDATDSVTATDTPSSAPVVATPTDTPAPVPPADACHQGGVTYCSLNPNVTQATIGSTICVSGWTATVRPPESYTEDLKRRQIAAEHLPGTLSDYEADHRMPLELGGAPSDVSNLSPESPPSPNPKDSEENALKRDVCDGAMSLATAQAQMVSDWLGAYPGYTH